MKQRQSEVIEGVKYEVGPMLTSEGLLVLTRITKLMAPTAAAALKTTEGADEEINIEGAVAALSANMEETVVVDTIKRLLNEKLCSRGEDERMLPLNFEQEFSGNFSTLFKVVKLALEVNYGDFFAVAKDLFGKALAKEAAKKPEK